VTAPPGDGGPIGHSADPVGIRVGLGGGTVDDPVVGARPLADDARAGDRAPVSAPQRTTPVGTMPADSG
jgi:hypothetical protein